MFDDLRLSVEVCLVIKVVVVAIKSGPGARMNVDDLTNSIAQLAMRFNSPLLCHSGRFGLQSFLHQQSSWRLNSINCIR